MPTPECSRRFCCVQRHAFMTSQSPDSGEIGRSERCPKAVDINSAGGTHNSLSQLQYHQYYSASVARLHFSKSQFALNQQILSNPKCPTQQFGTLILMGMARGAAGGTHRSAGTQGGT